MLKHLTFVELADPNSDAVDAVMNDAWFTEKPLSIGELVEHDHLDCKVLQTYQYTAESTDLSLTLAIIYPASLPAPVKEDWWCYEADRMTAAAGETCYQTRHIFVSQETQRVVDLSTVYDWDADLAPKNETSSIGDWNIKECHTFTCEQSPVPTLYVAACEKQSSKILCAA